MGNIQSGLLWKWFTKLILYIYQDFLNYFCSIPDEWVTEKEYVAEKSVIIPSLNPSAKDALNSCLFPPARRRLDRRRKNRQQTWYKFFVNKLYNCKKSWVSLCNKSKFCVQTVSQPTINFNLNLEPLRKGSHKGLLLLE